MPKFAVVSFLLLSFSLSAGATPITYTISGIGSGELFTPSFPANQTPFTNLPFSFDLTADTIEVQTIFLNARAVVADTGTLQVGSLVGSIPSRFMGLLESGGGTSLLNDQFIPYFINNITMNMASSDPAFASYDLTSSIGPIPVSTVLNPEQRIQGYLLFASFGSAILDSVSDVTFTANLATPEPASLALLGVGVVGLGVFKRKLTH